MPNISYREVVITCEACKTIKKFGVDNYEECLKIFQIDCKRFLRT